MSTPTLPAAIRRLRGLDSQDMLAARMGVSRVTIARWECGTAQPSLRHARSLVEMGLDPDTLPASITGEVA